MAVEVGSAPARGYSREYYQPRPSPTFWAEVRHLMSLAGGEGLELGCGGGDSSAARLGLGLLPYFRDRCLTLFLLARKSREVGRVKSGNGIT